VTLELTAGAKNAASNERIASVFFMVPPLPHARELEGWPVQRCLHGLLTSPVSWLGEKELWWTGQAEACRYRVHSLPSRGENWPQWLASTTFALQSRGGDGVAPSSRARSPRLKWRGRARYGLRLPAVRGLSATGSPPSWGLQEDFYLFEKSVTRGRPEGVISTESGA
jgi:hypothetical protein